MVDSGVLVSILIVAGLCVLFCLSMFLVVRLSRSWREVLKQRVIKAVQRRRNKTDTFRQENGYSWDYVLVFKVYEEEDPVSELQCKFSMRYILDKLGQSGMEIRLFFSIERHEVFCKLRTKLTRLQKHADLINYELPFDPKSLRTLCLTGREDLWDPLKIPDEHPETHINPYDFIYGRYEFDESIHRTHPDVIYIYKRWPRLELNEEVAANIDSHLAAAAAGGSANDFDTDGSTRFDTSAVADSNAAASSSGFQPSARASTVPYTLNPLAQQPVAGGTSRSASVASSSAAAEEKKDVEQPTGVTGATNAASDTTAVVVDTIKMSRKEESKMFRGVDRLKLMQSIIAYGGLGGCGLDLPQLIEDDCLLAYFPLHDMVEMRTLEANWMTLLQLPWYQPVDQVKNYYGEKIGLYFLWLGTYTSWLMIAAVFGFFFWIDVAVENNNPSTQSVPYFAGLMALWSVLFLEHWKRTEKTTAMKWGTVGFEETEQDRPQFYGESVLSPIDGRPKKYFSAYRRFKKAFTSRSLILSMVVIVIGVIAAIFAVRIAMNRSGSTIAGVELSGVVASILLALQIQILNKIFGDYAIVLNDRENHRTDTEYEDALIAKTFSFQFVNSFASLFYIAFVKPFMQDLDACSDGGSCMSELQTSLATIFLMRLASGNLMEVGVPLVQNYLKQRKLAKEQQERNKSAGVADVSSAPEFSNDGVELSSIVGKELIAAKEQQVEISEVEMSYCMAHYDVMMGPFGDFAELAIQFGYTTMFVAAFPLATVLSFFNNYVEIRVDAWKLLHLFRRAEPRSAEDIGTWYYILEVLSISSIFTNSGLVAFTADNLRNYSWSARIWTFILMSSGLFAIRTIVAFLIPDVPHEVNIQLQRQEYLRGKVLDNIEDEDEDAHLKKNEYETPSFLIDETDVDPM